MKNIKKIVTVNCKCGFKLGIRYNDLEEIAAGVWGTIPCPKCKTRLNDKIKGIAELSSADPFAGKSNKEQT